MNFERKYDENDNFKCYCGSTIMNDEKAISRHYKVKKHQNYNNDKYSTTYYSKNKARILARINTEEYKAKQKNYQSEYYKKNRLVRIAKNKMYNSRNKNNTFIKCDECHILIRKYDRSKHNCNFTLQKLNDKNFIRCLCGDVIINRNKNSLYIHTKTARHSKRINDIFNK